jgi:hypothetical protein
MPQAQRQIHVSCILTGRPSMKRLGLLLLILLLLVLSSCLTYTPGTAGRGRVIPDRYGGYYTDEGHYISDRYGGWYTPDGGHIIPDGYGGWY